MKKLLVPFFLVGLLVSCSSDDVVGPIGPIDPVEPNPLKVPLIISSVSTNDILGLVDIFGLKKSMGLALFDDSEKIPSLVEYLTPDFPKDKVTKNTTKADFLFWHPRDPEKKIYLSNDVSEYKLFAFVPYDSKIDLNTPLDMKAQGYNKQNRVPDYCYCYASGLAFDSPEATLKLQHLYSRISLVIEKGTYTKLAKLDSIAFSGEGIYSAAKASFKEFNKVIYTDRKKTLVKDIRPISSTASAEYRFLMIPASANDFTDEATLTLWLDGDGKTSNSTEFSQKISKTIQGESLIELLPGVNYKISVLINDGGLVIDKVEAKLWN